MILYNLVKLVNNISKGLNQSTLSNSIAPVKDINLSFDFQMYLTLEDVWLILHMSLDQIQGFDRQKDFDYLHVALSYN